MKYLLLILFFILSLGANERVVSLSPSLTEIIYALDKGKNIVATSSYSLYPPAAKKLPIIGGYENPHLERILSFEPTLVVGQDFNRNLLDKLQKFHIKTLSLKLRTLKDIQKGILRLGKVLASTTKAKKLTANITNAITNAPKAKHPHSVMIVYGLREDLRSRTYIAGHNIFFEDIIEQCGNTNAFTAQTTDQPVLAYENIIALNPDQVIILHSKATEPNVDVNKALENWKSIPINAAHNNRISIVDEDYLHIPSNRVALTIKRLCGEMND